MARFSRNTPNSQLPPNKAALPRQRSRTLFLTRAHLTPLRTPLLPPSSLHISPKLSFQHHEGEPVACSAGTRIQLSPSADTPGFQFVPLRDFEDVTSALNFDTGDCHVVGGCDLYTTKAAGSDKKLYAQIENSLESQYESVLRLSQSLSPPQAESFAESMNLSRSSPFGSLSQISSRRTYAYLIATLNASHPDYDFSHILRPTDFRRERSLKSIMNTVDSTLYNLRPRTSAALLAMPSNWGMGFVPPGAQTPGGSQVWGPRMWKLIDNEMTLRECAIYSYSPEEDPFDEEEGTIWGMNYFFFNKQRKRVCYLYIRGLSIISQSPVEVPVTPIRNDSARASSVGTKDRRRYWLDDQVDDDDTDSGSGVEEGIISRNSPEESFRYTTKSLTASPTTSMDMEAEDEASSQHEKSAVQDINEHIAESMEV